MPTHSLSDYTSWIERTWQGQVSFTELVTYAETLNSHPALCAALYRTWLQRNTGVFNSVAWFNLGVILFAENNLIDSIEAFQKALALSPAFPQAHINLGLALERQGNAEAAIEQWQAVVENAITPEADQNTGPNQADQIKNLTMALNNIGRLQETRRQYQAATQALEKSLQLDPDQPDAIHHLIFQRQKQCQWPVYAPVDEVTEAALREHTSALAMLNISDDPAAQLEAALNYSRRKIPADLPRLSPANGYRHDKIRVAYCSSDFCTHPVAMLTVELFEHHDKNRFETHAFCWSPDDGSTLRQRILSAVDHYIPVHGKSDDEVAQLIRQHEIDILIDLQGQTSGAKTRMLAMRPAPVQITYLGLPATTGLPGIDYVIADRYLIPEEYARFYSEKPLYMPDVYQVSDRKREHSPAPSRKDCGLPARKFVFCSFNNNHKYTLEVFTTWMNILRRVPNSVLWLLADNPWARENLQKQAKAQGIDPKRLVFAERTTPADYLARYLVADLFLDTFPFNAGTTANDALWMGLPVLTMSGRSFASRMAGALLTAADLPELITHDLQTYEDKAVALAADTKARKTMRQKLALAKESGPLFDSLRFTRNLEQQYTALVTNLNQQTQIAQTTAFPSTSKQQNLKKITDVATKAEQLQEQGNIEGAIQLYRQWLEHAHSGDEWIAQFNLGILLRDGGDTTGAQQAFQAVLKQKPDFVQARAALEQVITITPGQTINQVSVVHNDPTLSSSRNVRLFTLAWSPETCSQTDPDITILDNTANSRPDWREYWPIRHFLKNSELEENTLYGFLSPKFFAKTGLSGDAVIHFIREHSNDVDVFTFSPQADMSAFFLNVFEQGEIFDPGFMDTCQALAREIGITANLHTLIMDSRQTVFSNFIVATPAFWRHWLTVCEKIFQLAETDNSPLARQINAPTTYPGQVPRKVFIIERIASLLLATGQWKSQPYSTFRCAWSALPTSRFRTEAVISDALKLAYNKTQDGEYKKAYGEIRKQIFENKQAQQV
ncbi:tetratricopeptide repeat protein [Nitrosomonas europaea]|uniref:O-linked N-acetylglucosamine transferase family protein n=1 Tax=Nitrosomonas europaea TaxID=915 RepID=UPI0032666C64